MKEGGNDGEVKECVLGGGQCVEGAEIRSTKLIHIQVLELQHKRKKGHQEDWERASSCVKSMDFIPRHWESTRVFFFLTRLASC